MTIQNCSSSASISTSDSKEKKKEAASPWLIVGLGNPGKKYAATRHNVGFEMVDTIAEAEGISMTTVSFKALFGKGFIGDVPVILAKPQTFMNLSGESVGTIVSYYKIPVKQVLVIVDDLDLPFAKLRLLPKGGHGGHNGMKSVINHFKGNTGFPRLRIGIGRPPGKMDPVAFVLHTFTKQKGKRTHGPCWIVSDRSEGPKANCDMKPAINGNTKRSPCSFCTLESFPSSFRWKLEFILSPNEVSAIVIDLGSHTCKAGYAGEDAPKAVFPSVVGAIDQMDIDGTADINDENSDKTKGKCKLYVGSQSLGYRRDHMEVLSPLKNGVVVDWNIVDNIWDHALRECLLVDPKERPMLLAEPCSNTQEQRERAAELMFEKYKVPALFLAKNAVLTSFASGRATSLVVDSGGGSTTVVPVLDGYVLQKAVIASPIGGEFLTDCLMKSLEGKGITIRPRCSFKKKEIHPGNLQTVDLDFPHTTESYKLYSQRVIASDIKECVCRTPDSPYDERVYSNIPMTPYELPDGQIIEVGSDRFKIPDILFNPLLVQTIPGMESFAEIAPSIRGLPKMIIESINKCDVDIRRELFSTILLTGGTASMHQLKERIEKDLLEESPQAARVKVFVSGNATERRFSVWIGGSILASLGSFQQMWFSKSEYEEQGASYIQRKCP
ncbi:Actin-related protein 4 [Glycine soja]|nr:Actin-related protein 4 [Glycine soja]